jgi:hypothetical protein
MIFTIDSLLQRQQPCKVPKCESVLQPLHCKWGTKIADAAYYEYFLNVFYTEVGTRYFFHGPLLQVHCLEIVLLLRAGPQLSKIW